MTNHDADRETRRWKVYGDRLTRSSINGDFGGADEDFWVRSDPQPLADAVNADYDRLERERDALSHEVTALRQWKETLIDAAVVHWCLTEENKDDPYKMLMDVCNTVVEWENDPAISETAAKRQDELTALRTALTEAQAALDKLAKGDSHSEALAEDRHCPACRASLDFEKHDSDCYIIAALAAAAKPEAPRGRIIPNDY